MILIGSTALKYHYPDFPREPSDKDWVVNERDYKHPFKLKERVEFLYNPILYKRYNGFGIIKPEDLLTLKMSHLIYNIKWDKHCFDMLWLMDKGVKYDLDLFYELVEFWKTIHKSKRSNLKMSAKDFFDNAIEFPIPHDKLHELLTYPNPPTYKKILVGEVETSKEKFDALSFEDKCNLVREEIFVMGMERFNHLPYKNAYYKMFRKFIQGHAPIYEIPFILENFNLLYTTDFDFITFFKNKIND